MSGGVGLTSNDIRLPNEQEQGFPKAQEDVASVENPHKTAATKKAGFLSFSQLKCLAIVVVLAASGTVSPEDFGFVAFPFIYMYFLSKIAFSRLSLKDGSVFNTKGLIFRTYVLAGAIIGLYLPSAYIFEGIFEGDKEGIKAAAPHVFLLAGQVFMEGVAFSDRFPLPISVFVPVFLQFEEDFYDFGLAEVSKVEGESGGSTRRSHVGRVLAMANLAFWCYNLFGLLLPLYLPKAFNKYYSEFKAKD